MVIGPWSGTDWAYLRPQNQSAHPLGLKGEHGERMGNVRFPKHVRVGFHVPVRSVFFEKKMGGPVKRGWRHVAIPLTQGPVSGVDGCPTFIVVQEWVPKDWWS